MCPRLRRILLLAADTRDGTKKIFFRIAIKQREFDNITLWDEQDKREGMCSLTHRFQNAQQPQASATLVQRQTKGTVS